MKKKTFGARSAVTLFRAALTIGGVASVLVACDDAESGAASVDGGSSETTEEEHTEADSTSDDGVSTADSLTSGTNSDTATDDNVSSSESAGSVSDEGTSLSSGSEGSDTEASDTDPSSDPGTAPSSSNDAGGEEPGTAVADAGVEPEPSRLQPRYIVLEDGSQVFDTFVDTELGKPCRFEQTSNVDGEAAYHCIAPIYASVSYLDADCTVPVVNLNVRGCGELDPDRLVGVYFPSDVENCAGPQRLFTLGEALEADTVYQSYFAGQCDPRDATNMELYAATEPDFSQYVEGSLRTELLADGLELQYVDSSEGDTELWSFGVDGETCGTASLNGDSSAERCLPSSTTYVWDRYFAEATCTGQELTPFGATTCATASSRAMAVRAEPVADSCGQTLELQEISAVETPNPMAYQGTAEACGLYEPAFEAEWYALGASIDPATFPALEREELGNGRLRARARTSLSGEVLNVVEWYDTELDSSCEPVDFSDGTKRCFFGTIGAYPEYYSDIACTEPVYFAQESGCFTFPERPLLAERNEDEACYVVDRVFELDSYEGPLYVLSDSCQPAAALPAGGAVFVQGAEVPVTEFATLTYLQQP